MIASADFYRSWTSWSPRAWSGSMAARSSGTSVALTTRRGRRDSDGRSGPGGQCDWCTFALSDRRVRAVTPRQCLPVGHLHRERRRFSAVGCGCRSGVHGGLSGVGAHVGGYGVLWRVDDLLDVRVRDGTADGGRLAARSVPQWFRQPGTRIGRLRQRVGCGSESGMRENQQPSAGNNEGGAPTEGRWLTRGVLSVGAASLGSDAGHELTTSLLPSFLTSILHAGPAALGAIEGVSDALVGLSKLAGGPLSSDPVRRGRLASGGYLVTAFATAAIGLATAVWQVALLRALGWMSRGLRSPARDTLLVSLVARSAYG